MKDENIIVTLDSEEQLKKVETWLFGLDFPEEIKMFIYIKETGNLYPYKTVLFRNKWMLATNEEALEEINN